MSVDWNSHEMRKWREVATQEQQGYFDLLGNRMWNKYKPSDYNILKRNIGYALFGLPDGKPDPILNNNTGYTRKKLKHIDEVFDAIMKCKKKHRNQEDILVSFVFVSGKVDDHCISIPVIRVPECDSLDTGNNIFIDSCPRVYSSWQDYLKCNRLPDLVLCYPKNGVYSAVNGLEVEFGVSPAGKTGAKVLEGCDIAGSVLGLGAAAVGTATLFVPVALPAVGAALAVSVLTGGYAIGRSSDVLVDRAQHQQSIGLDNAESRNCWLNIGGSVMSVASGGATVAGKMAQAGEGMVVVGQIAVKSVTAGSCVVNALGIVNGLANIIHKAVNENEVSSLDIFQFLSSVLFFTNSVISTHQAYALLNNIKQSGTGQHNVLTVMNRISNLRGRSMNSMAGITEAATHVSGVAFSYPVVRLYFVRETLFDKCKFVCRELIKITESLLKGLITTAQYVWENRKLLKMWWVSWNEEISEVIRKICQAFGVKDWSDIIIQGCKILEEGTPGLMRWIACVLLTERNSLPENEATDEIIKISAKFADLQGCKNAEDLLTYMRFVCKFVRSEFEREKANNKKMWEMVREFSPNSKIEDFYRKCGISGNPDAYFLQTVLEKFREKGSEGFFLLKFAYDSQNAISSAQEEAGQSFFDMDGITFHPFVNKTGQASNGMLSSEQLYMMAAELTGQHADKDNVSLVEDGATAIMQINGGAIFIAVSSHLEDGKVSGIATVLRRPSHL